MSRIDGFLPLRKPANQTSFQVLGPIKKLLPGSKVGHTGTLDRFAEGLLLVVCGQMTRLTPILTGLDKEYVAEVRFGMETTTLDPEGEITEEGPIPDPDRVRAAAGRFVGCIEQIPPQYSAIHVGGERAYRAARQGRVVELAPRAVTIKRLSLESFVGHTARMRVECSSGTYIRALARDLGRACGSRAHLSRLVRTRVGPFDLEEAVSPDEFDPARDLRGWHACLSRLATVKEALTVPGREAVFRRGGQVDDRDFRDAPADGHVAVYGESDQFLALMVREEGKYRYEIVAAPAGH